jgi:hypothetical protein
MTRSCETVSPMIIAAEDTVACSPVQGLPEVLRRLYDRAGVTEYWIVDPDIEVVGFHL